MLSVSSFFFWHIQIEIVLGKSDKFDSLMTPAAEEEAVANMGEKPVEAEAREGKNEWPTKHMSRISIIFFITITSKLFCATTHNKECFIINSKVIFYGKTMKCFFRFGEGQWNVMLIIFRILICHVNLAWKVNICCTPKYSSS